jgi:DnaJ-class molecular chaperone
MICPTCRGRGFVPTVTLDDVTAHEPCPDCMGSGIASCCDAAGSAVIAQPDDEDE